jgi:hypothetical protein
MILLFAKILHMCSDSLYITLVPQSDCPPNPSGATLKGWKLTSSKTPLHSKNSSAFLHLWASSSAHS